MSPSQTVPCQVFTHPLTLLYLHPNASPPCSQYRTGKTLGSGTYAIVKEAVHIKTGTYYACKVINKKLMEGREHMVDSFLWPVGPRADRRSYHPQVRNEIAVLKKVSKSHRNIVTLHDYFEVLPMSFLYRRMAFNPQSAVRPPIISTSVSISALAASSSIASVPRGTTMKSTPPLVSLTRV